MSGFVTYLRLAQEVFDQYKIDYPKWWKRMDGTPIFNDVAVFMAQKLVENESEKNKLITELCDALGDCRKFIHAHCCDVPYSPDLEERAREATR